MTHLVLRFTTSLNRLEGFGWDWNRNETGSARSHCTIRQWIIVFRPVGWWYQPGRQKAGWWLVQADGDDGDESKETWLRNCRISRNTSQMCSQSRRLLALFGEASEYSSDMNFGKINEDVQKLIRSWYNFQDGWIFGGIVSGALQKSTIFDCGGNATRCFWW